MFRINNYYGENRIDYTQAINEINNQASKGYIEVKTLGNIGDSVFQHEISRESIKRNFRFSDICGRKISEIYHYLYIERKKGMETKMLKQIESAVTILEKELGYAGKVCKYCRYNGRNLEHPGFCIKLNRVPIRPHVAQCSWFDLRNAQELIEILREEEAERLKVIATERARVAELARKVKYKEHHKAEVGDPIDEPEVNDVDSQDDVERFIQEVSISNE